MRETRRTALRRHARLEAEGVWRADARAPARAVDVSLGEASLTIEAEGRPLAHWSLPALERLGRAEPARYGASGGAETLEIADVEMVAAIERVRHALARRPGRRRPGRVLAPAALVLGAAALVLALPGLLRDRAVTTVPAEARAALAEALLTRVGRRCAGSPALDELAVRLAAGGVSRIVAVEGPPAPLALPGGLVALPPETVRSAAEPGVTAGRVLAAIEAAGPDGPLARLLEEGGPTETLRLLVSATVSEAALDTHAARLLAPEPGGAPTGEAIPGLLARFDATGLSSAPYGRAARVEALRRLDPHPGAEPALPDRDWIALQSLCDG